MTDTDDPKTSPDGKAKTARSQREPISESILAELNAHIERTGVGPIHLLRGALDKPEGLRHSNVNSWLRGIVKTADPAHVDYMLKRWAMQPGNKRIPLTTDMQAKLVSEYARTGLGPVQIFKRATNVPAGLTHTLVQAWTYDREKPGTVGEAYWTYVIERLCSLPDSTPVTPHVGQVGRKRRAEIDAESLAELRLHRSRTGIGGAILLRTAADKPALLTPGMISGWLNGTVKNADPELITYVLTRYRAWP